jgi:hypothetical protein
VVARSGRFSIWWSNPYRLLDLAAAIRHLAEDPANKHMSLSEYDVVIAIDPDWTQLDENQAKLLKGLEQLRKLLERHIQADTLKVLGEL